MPLKRLFFALTLAGGLTLLALVVGAQLQGPSSTGRLVPLWPVPAFAFHDQRGALVTRESLLGKVWVANFIFTQCRTICPSMTTKMVQLQRQLAGVDARFVSFSVDPARDTPEVLAAYAQRWRADEPRWSLLATDPQALPGLARDFRVVAQPNTQKDAIDPILHSATFLLVDQLGVVRGVYDSDEPIGFKALGVDLRALARQPEVLAAALPVTGAGLYHALSCDACHDKSGLAPLLGGLLGTRRLLEHAQSATFDAAYVRESILQPELKRVEGFPLKMPTYEGLLDEARLLTLVKWILELPTPAGQSQETATTRTDPVCGMQVRASSDALAASHEGKTWYFCSEVCRERFVANPSQVLRAAAPPASP